jgi:hypothetical protein
MRNGYPDVIRSGSPGEATEATVRCFNIYQCFSRDTGERVGASTIGGWTGMIPLRRSIYTRRSSDLPPIQARNSL